jgi:Calx-beta domain-containing protein
MTPLKTKEILLALGTTQTRTISRLLACLFLVGTLGATKCLAQDLAFVGFTTSGLSIPEFEPEAWVEVRRTGNLDTTVSVDYSAVPWNGAISGEDYTDVSGTLTFPAGKGSDFIRLPILNDGEPEPIQGVQITLSNPSVGVQIGLSSSLVRVIDNDNQTPVGPLIVAVGGSVVGDWSRQDLRWGQGYPAADVRFDSDESVGGGQRQSMWDNEFARGSTMNDQPGFITNYTSNLRVNALVANTGRVTLTYDLAFGTQLVDLMILDVDDEDHVRIECRGLDGNPLDPGLLQILMQGDLSRFVNAPPRPASEAASPPVWDPVAGTLTASVVWNENRSFTILRPSVPLSSVTLTFTGKRAAPPGDWGSHIYAALWATSRAFQFTETRRNATGESELRWTSLPGVPYRILRSSNLVDWVQAWAGEGAALPELTTQAVVPNSEAASAQFFKIRRW